MKIGELASKVGISTQTVRYYEREGLLQQPPRTSSGYREYSHQALDTLTFILEAKAVGFTLREIKQIHMIKVESQKSCSFMQELLQSKLDELDDKLVTIKRIRGRLAGLSNKCQQCDNIETCPVLVAFRKP